MSWVKDYLKAWYNGASFWLDGLSFSALNIVCLTVFSIISLVMFYFISLVCIILIYSAYCFEIFCK